MPPGNENGTPLPKDEPFAENRPSGAILDYYLKAAPSAPVVLEILDASGQTIRRFSSDDRPAPRNPDTLNIPAIWARRPSRCRPRRACIDGCGTCEGRRRRPAVAPVRPAVAVAAEAAAGARRSRRREPTR